MEYHRIFPIALSALLSITLHAQQGPCDSLNIISVTYAPFTDTALQVTAINESSIVFNYPQFSLIGLDDDTIAHETLHFFGMVPGFTQVHRLDLAPGMTMPAEEFIGTIGFSHFTLDGVQQCFFPIETSLCPQEECIPLIAAVYNTSGLPVSTEFNWQVTDSDQNTVASGTMEMIAGVTPNAIADLCLPAGEYVLHLDQIGNTGTTFLGRLTQASYELAGPEAEFQAGVPISIPFTYYPLCLSIGMGVNEIEPSVPQITFLHDQLLIVSMDGTALGALQVIDATGRTIATEMINGSSAVIGSNASSGIYFLRSMDRRWPTLRFLVP